MQLKSEVWKWRGGLGGLAFLAAALGVTFGVQTERALVPVLALLAAWVLWLMHCTRKYEDCLREESHAKVISIVLDAKGRPDETQELPTGRLAEADPRGPEER